MVKPLSTKQDEWNFQSSNDPFGSSLHQKRLITSDHVDTDPWKLSTTSPGSRNGYETSPNKSSKNDTNDDQYFLSTFDGTMKGTEVRSASRERLNAAARGRMMEGTSSSVWEPVRYSSRNYQQNDQWKIAFQEKKNQNTNAEPDSTIIENRSSRKWDVSSNDDAEWDDQAERNNDWRFFNELHSADDTPTAGTEKAIDLTLGSADRPISLHEIIATKDVLDKREQDVLQLAALKKVQHTSPDKRNFEVVSSGRGRRTQDKTSNKEPLAQAESAYVIAKESTSDGLAGIMRFFGGSGRNKHSDKKRFSYKSSSEEGIINSNETHARPSRRHTSNHEGEDGLVPIALDPTIGFGMKRSSSRQHIPNQQKKSTMPQMPASTRKSSSAMRTTQQVTPNRRRSSSIDRSIPTYDSPPYPDRFRRDPSPRNDASDWALETTAPSPRNADFERRSAENRRKEVVTRGTKYSPESTTKSESKILRDGDYNLKTNLEEDPFDVNSPAFVSGDPFQKKASSPSDGSHTARGGIPMEPVPSDDFSDPFFQGSGRPLPPDTVQTTRTFTVSSPVASPSKTRSVQPVLKTLKASVLQHDTTDPDLDHLNLPETDEDEGSSLVAPTKKRSEGEEKKEYDLYDDQGVPFSLRRSSSPSVQMSLEASKEPFRSKRQPPQLESKPKHRTSSLSPPPQLPPPPPPPQNQSALHKNNQTGKSSLDDNRFMSKRNKRISTKGTKALSSQAHHKGPGAGQRNKDFTSTEPKEALSQKKEDTTNRKLQLEGADATNPHKTAPAATTNGISVVDSWTKRTCLINTTSPGRKAVSRSASPIKSITIPQPLASASRMSNNGKVMPIPVGTIGGNERSKADELLQGSVANNKSIKARQNVSNSKAVSVVDKPGISAALSTSSRGKVETQFEELTSYARNLHGTVRNTADVSKRWHRRSKLPTQSTMCAPTASKQDLPLQSQNTGPVPPPKIKRISSHKAIKDIANSRQILVNVAPHSFEHKQVLSSSSDDSNALHQVGTLESLSSVGSDIQRLRSILRRSRASDNPDKSRFIEPLESAFAVYDESKIKDPMQRAGLRLLSAAVIPIQAAARRHLAFRLALTRMWAIVVIQAIIRRYIVRSTFWEQKRSAIKIQSLYRGTSLRDQMLLEQCCAIEIQRHVRGLLSTLRVYKSIYKITIIQACIRRKLAMDTAMDRMVSIIQIQSLIRGYLSRSKYNQIREATVQVQAAWRCFACRFAFQLDLLDMVMVQSIWRRKLAMRYFYRLRSDIKDRSATSIQTQWRRYDCLMNYREYRAAVTIQRVWRGYDCKVNYREYKAASKIQSKWRGYVCWITYREHVSATLIQTCWRRYQDRKTYLVLVSVIKVQSTVRAWSCRLKYVKNRAAIVIQSHWRSYDCTMSFLHFLADVLIVQSTFRRWIAMRMCKSIRFKNATIIQTAVRSHLARKHLKMLHSAVVIQKAWRAFVCYADYMFTISDIVVVQSMIRRWLKKKELPILLQARDNKACTRIQSRWRCFHQTQTYMSMVREFHAAICIQSEWRRYSCRCCHTIAVTSATKIASACRGYLIRQKYLTQQYCAIVIQKSVRQLLASKDNYYVATGYAVWQQCSLQASIDSYSCILVQTTIRCFLSRRAFVLYRNSRKIQATWRGHFIRFHVNLYVKARKIQTLWRAYAIRASYLAFVKSRSIQMAWRSYKARSVLIQYLSCRRVQNCWRRYHARKFLVHFTASRLIQAAWRGYVVRVEIALYLTARSIQTVWRGFAHRQRYKLYNCAKAIQSSWRMFLRRTHYVKYRNARIIQAIWRGHAVRIQYVLFLTARAIQCTWRGYTIRVKRRRYRGAAKIQACWRGYLTRVDIALYCKARTIQAVFRGHLARIDVSLYLKARAIQAAWRGYVIRVTVALYVSAQSIQRAWRGLSARNKLRSARMQSLMKSQLAVLKLQSTVRRWQQMNAYKKHSASRKIQTKWRGFTSRKFLLEYSSAKKIQSLWRGFSLQTIYQDYMAARRIQSKWRAYSLRSIYQDYISARRIQSRWRGYLLRVVYQEYKAARKIQSLWRGYSIHTAYVDYIAARKIQTNWRGSVLRNAYRKRRAVHKIQCAWKRFVLQTLYNEHEAAVTIQTTWRCLWVRSMYVKYVSARRIQSVWRGVTFRSNRTLAAQRIQTVWRGACLRLAYKEYMAARTIQARWRGAALRIAFIEYCAVRKIQAIWRGAQTRLSFKWYLATRSIQTLWRGYYHRRAYKHHVAARKLQKCWRGYVPRCAYKEYVCSRTIQAYWRCARLRNLYKLFISAKRIQIFWRVSRLQRFLKNTYTSLVAAKRIQSIWRGFSVRVAYKEYVGARKIQACWRSKRLLTVYKTYIVSRKQYLAAQIIQKVWRGRIVFSAYVYYVSARLIQKVWRMTLVSSAYRKFVAARRIQAKWRQVIVFATRYSELQKGRGLEQCAMEIGEKYFIAAQVIQSSWRRLCVFRSYSQRMSTRRSQHAYRQFNAARQIQSFWRRVKLQQCIEINFDAKSTCTKVSEIAARTIQRNWRSYCSRQDFWHILGSIIQIQAVVRGWMAKDRLRRYIATKNKVASAEVESILSPAERRKKDVAARKIQRFLLMVKAEVEKEMRAERKRRKAKKKVKKRTDECDDNFLDTVWRKTVEQDRLTSTIVRKANEAAASEITSSKKICSESGVASKWNHGKLGVRTSTLQVSSPIKRVNSSGAAIRIGAKPPKRDVSNRRGGSIIPDLLDNITSAMRRWPDESNDVVSHTSAYYFYKNPPSRLKAFSQLEIDEDWNLEEAFTDFEFIERKALSGTDRNSSTARSVGQTHGNPWNPASPYNEGDRSFSIPSYRTPVRTQEV